jgi:hypothetical protein
MPSQRAALAELALMLVMPPKAASATVGDLLESAPGPGAFWRSIARTWASLAFRQLSWGTFANALALTIVLTLALRAAFFGVLNAAEPLVPNLAWMGPIIGVLFLLLQPVFSGWLVARWLPGREIAAWLSVTLFVALLCFFWWKTPLVVWTHVPLTPVSLLPYFVGVLLARRRTLRLRARV